MHRFEGRRVIVSGGASGIGKATVLRLLDEQATVVATDINESALENLVGEAANRNLVERLTTLRMDIGDEASVTSGIASAISTLGGLDVLVNAAGILRSTHTETTSLDDFNLVIRINLTGTFLTIRESLPALIQSPKSVIVNFSSTSANFAHPYMSAYAASKGGILSMTHAIAAEFSEQGLRAVCVAPGGIATPLVAGAGHPEDANFELFAKHRPALKAKSGSDIESLADASLGAPENVAGVVAMLASDDGAYITGTEVRIDGGAHM